MVKNNLELVKKEIANSKKVECYWMKALVISAGGFMGGTENAYKDASYRFKRRIWTLEV